MALFVRLLATFAVVLPAIAQQEPQLASQPATQSQPSSQLGVRYSAATDVSHISFNSPLVTYGSSLNEIQLPAAPIQPANLKQAPQDATSENTSQEDERQTSVRSFGNQDYTQQAVQKEQQIQADQHQSYLNQQQFISVQQYPARPQGFSLRQDLPGPQPQAVNRYAPQFSAVQSQPPVLQQQQYVQPQVQQQQQYIQPHVQHQQQYVQPQQQYATAQPQIQYASAPPQVQYASAPPQTQYVLPQQQVQYQNPVSYSSPSSNAYFATGPFTAQYPTSNLVAGQYPAQVSDQTVAPQYAQIGPQYAAQQSSGPVGYSSAPAQLVSRVSFSGPTAGFSYGF